MSLIVCPLGPDVKLMRFKCAAWELDKVESSDVMDAVLAPHPVDSRRDGFLRFFGRRR